MTDPRITQVETLRNEIKTLAADLHTLPYTEMRAHIAKIGDLSINIFWLNLEIETYPYAEGTFTNIETYAQSGFLYVKLDEHIYIVNTTDGKLLPTLLNKADGFTTVRHVEEFLSDHCGPERLIAPEIKEVTGEDLKIGYSEEKYDGWGFSNKGHDYMFYKGSAVRRHS